MLLLYLSAAGEPVLGTAMPSGITEVPGPWARMELKPLGQAPMIRWNAIGGSVTQEGDKTFIGKIGRRFQEDGPSQRRDSKCH